MKKNKLTSKEKKESIWITLGRVRGIAKNTNNQRLLLLVDKISGQLEKVAEEIKNLPF